MLDGKFAFILLDKATNRVYAGRDHMGICPLYIAYGHDGSVWFASEVRLQRACCGVSVCVRD